MRLLLLAVVVSLSAAPVAAQSLPDWAAPEPTAWSVGAPSAATSGAAASGAAASAPPDVPGGSEPTQVPLEGGLGLLAAAGAAYAARRLRAAG